MRFTHLARVVSVTLVLVAAAAVAATDPSGRKMYKWVDSQGEVHFGDHIPPEYAAQEQHIVNSQGVETAHIDAQKTPQQLALDEQKRLEAEQRANRDKTLLNTYSSVAEIERLRDQRLALLSDQIKVTSQFLEILNGRLKKLSATSMRFRPYNSEPKAPPMSDQIAEDLVHTDNDIRTQQENLREKRDEESTMRQQFDNDIARFRELKGLH